MIKKILGFAAGAGMLLATVTPAFAVTIQCGNQITGPSSINDCYRNNLKSKTLGLTNIGNIVNNVTKYARSGNNTANTNTNGGSVTTLESTADLDSLSSLNVGDVTVVQSDEAADETGLNETTGPSSSNTVNLTANRTVALTIGNNGNVTNNVTGTAVSGDNTANSNTVGGTVSTGASRIGILLTNILNSITISVTQ